ncbi:radical SAM protein [Candidatus Parcubacteria bacterium]|nr:radical SAM protein [Patescibacteria group bacterium]MCG2699742.1 radical SAM protein [Candidatus Parcubacteria bacterium]
MNFRPLLSFYKNNPDYIKFFLRSLPGRSKPFYSLIFQITNVCNSRCVTCFNWKILNKDIDKELTLKEIEKFTKKLGDLHTVTIGGGEPFLRDDLVEIVGCFNRNNNIKMVAIPTNCLSVDKILTKTEEILNRFKGGVKIGLSLDGIGKDHDKIRGIEGNFEKFLETYRGLSKLKKKYSKLRLRICTTVFNLNIDKVVDLVKYVENNLPEADIYGGLELLRGDYNQSKVKEADLNKFAQVVEILKKENKNENNFYKRVIIPIYHRLSLDILRKKKQIISCRISAFYPVVDALGNVYPCENRKKIGNLREFDYDLTEIWQSEEAKRMRKSIRKKECYCAHSCYQIPNIYLSPKMIFKIIKGEY